MCVGETALPQGMLVGRGYIVDSLDGAIRDGDHGLKVVPGLLMRVCNEECWRARYIESTKECVEFTSFVEFVESSRPEGLGVDLETLRKVCRDDVKALDVIDRETRRPAHRPRTSDNVTTSIKKPERGNAMEYALSKLRTDAPELHRQVLDGALSPHAAMVEAGFRRKTFTVPLDPEKAAITLTRHFTPDELNELLRTLSEMIRGR